MSQQPTIEWLTPKTRVRELEQARAFALEMATHPRALPVRKGLSEWKNLNTIREGMVNGERYIVAKMGNRVVGMINLQTNENRVNEYYAIVHPEYSRGGIYRKLTGTLIRYCQKEGITLVRRELVSESSVAWHQHMQKRLQRFKWLGKLVEIKLRGRKRKSGTKHSALITVHPRTKREK